VSFGRWLGIYGPSYLEGLAQTGLIALVSAACAIAWGGALLLARLAGGRAGARIVDGYVQVFRNTPVLLWIYLIYFAFPPIGLTWPAVVCGGLALMLQNGAYISEIFRGSFKAIELIQFDAARSLGLSWWATFRKIVLPQVLVHSLPALGNQVILLLKDTSLLSAISVAELTMNAKLLTEQTGAAYEAFVVVAILYLVLVVIVELGIRWARHMVSWRPPHHAL